MTSRPITSDRVFLFEGFRFDVSTHRLWRPDGREIRLRAKPWDVLRCLVEQAGRLVTKTSIHRAVWGDAIVTDDVLTQSIGELRRALGDDPRRPRFIETVHRRGFRFIAPVERADVPAHAESVRAASAGVEAASPGVMPLLPLVGRDAPLRELRAVLRRARQGERQLVFITGEAGIGKTTLCDAFLRSASLHDDVLTLHGQCIQQHGQREPYMPILEALERMLNSPAGEGLRGQFRRTAPCWYVQMPGLVADGPPDALSDLAVTAPAERMLREGAAFLEAVAARRTVVLVLEDLHWSDAATADLLSYVAQRSGPARLLVIGTFRPAEASTYEHPIREVKQTLRVRRRCTELALDYLSAADVRAYLSARFDDAVAALAPAIHERTDGNPLFTVAIMDDLVRRGRLTRVDGGWTVHVPDSGLDATVPDDLTEMMALQFRRLSVEDQAVLEVASVVGLSFDPHTVARALGMDIEDVETRALRMARFRLFVHATGRAQEAAATHPFGFIHALHHHMIYEQIPEQRRRRLHHTVAETLESASGERAPELAAELSVHFERAGDRLRAVTHLMRCVTRARQRFAPREALAFGARALEHLEELPETPARDERELELRLLLGVSLSDTRGYTSDQVRDNYERARRLCERAGDARRLFEVVHAAYYRQLAGALTDGARESVEDLARIAESLGPEFRWRARLARGRMESWSGRFDVAATMMLECVDEIRARPPELGTETYGVDPVVAAFSHGGFTLWFVGRADQARALAEEGLRYAEKSGRPFERASALCYAARIELMCGAAREAAVLAARAHAVCTESDIAHFLPVSQLLLGAAAAEQGDVGRGLPDMLAGLDAQRELVGPFLTDWSLAFIAAAYGRTGRWDEGIRCADEGLEVTAGRLERVYVRELWRVKGELYAGKGSAARRRAVVEAERARAAACFQRAHEIAREQGARALELRTAVSRVRFTARRDSHAEALDHLRAVLASFNEGFDTRDLLDAAALLRAAD